MCPLLLACFLANAQAAFAPTPIRWGGSPSKRFVLAPKAFSGLVPQELTILDRPGLSPDMIPHFTAKLDNTIAWNARGLCLEASGDKAGNVLRVNHCTGGSAQKWNWLPNSRGQDMIQLTGTSNCLDVNAKQNSLNGALVQLRECDDSASESWEFEENIFPPRNGEALRHSMRHVALSLMYMAALAVLSLGTWVVRSRAKPRIASASHCSEDRGVCLMLLDGQEIIPAVMAVGPIPNEGADVVGLQAAAKIDKASTPMQAPANPTPARGGATAATPARGAATVATGESANLGGIGSVVGLVGAGILARGASISAVKAREAEQDMKAAEERLEKMTKQQQTQQVVAGGFAALAAAAFFSGNIDVGTDIVVDAPQLQVAKTENVKKVVTDNVLELPPKTKQQGASAVKTEPAAEAAAEKIEAEGKAATERKAAEEKAAAEKRAAEEKAATERKAAEEKAAAERKAAEEKAAAERKAAEEKAAAEKRAAEETAAAEKRTAEEKAAAEKRAAEETAAAEKKAAQEKAVAEKTAAEAEAAKAENVKKDVTEKVLEAPEKVEQRSVSIASADKKEQVAEEVITISENGNKILTEKVLEKIRKAEAKAEAENVQKFVPKKVKEPEIKKGIQRLRDPSAGFADLLTKH